MYCTLPGVVPVAHGRASPGYLFGRQSPLPVGYGQSSRDMRPFPKLPYTTGTACSSFFHTLSTPTMEEGPVAFHSYTTYLGSVPSPRPLQQQQAMASVPDGKQGKDFDAILPLVHSAFPHLCFRCSSSGPRNASCNKLTRRTVARRHLDTEGRTKRRDSLMTSRYTLEDPRKWGRSLCLCNVHPSTPETSSTLVHCTFINRAGGGGLCSCRSTEGDGLPLRRVPGCLTTITACLGKPISLLGKVRSYGHVKNGGHSGRIRNTCDVFC